MVKFRSYKEMQRESVEKCNRREGIESFKHLVTESLKTSNEADVGGQSCHVERSSEVSAAILTA